MEENLASWAMLIFGLAFFTYTIHLIDRDHRESYRNWLNERREFGFPKPPKKRRLFVRRTR